MSKNDECATAAASVVTLWFNGPQTNGCRSDVDFPGNWMNYPAPCATNWPPGTNYRLSYAGSTNCQTAP
jgi:hypothetical protein